MRPINGCRRVNLEACGFSGFEEEGLNHSGEPWIRVSGNYAFIFFILTRDSLSATAGTKKGAMNLPAGREKIGSFGEVKGEKSGG